MHHILPLAISDVCLVLLLTITPLALSACAPAVVRHNEAGNERFGESAYGDAITECQLAQVAEPDPAEPYYNAANGYLDWADSGRFAPVAAGRKAEDLVQEAEEIIARLEESIT